MGLLAALSRELEELVAATAPSVVGVEPRNGSGSGLILSPDGYVLTNSHVVRQSERPRVRVGDESLPSRLVGADTRTDLAVLRVDAQSLPALPLRDDLEPRVGQLVVAIGNPLALQRSVSLGVISAVERTLPMGREGIMEGLVQTDAAINPGNSGGPLLDAEGRAIGVNVAVARFAQGIGFAIPARTATWVASELIRAGQVRRPYLGVAARGEPLNDPLSQSVGQARAVRVIQVDPSGPAARAGLRHGDLLLSANGRALWSVDDLQRVMVLGRPERLELEVWRGQRQAVVARPDPPRVRA